MIAFSATSMSEVCGIGAGYFDPTSPPSIREALARVLRDNAWQAALRESGRTRVEAFTWTAAAASTCCESAVSMPSASQPG